MEDVLKGLGYRGEPKPAADVKAKLEALDKAAREAAAKAAVSYTHLTLPTSDLV